MTDSSQPSALFIANNLALDFINTEYGTGAQRWDCFKDDKSTLDWLKRADLVANTTDHASAGLTKLAVALRAEARTLILAAKSNTASETPRINQLLKDECPIQALEWDPSSLSFKLAVYRRNHSPLGLLEPVAQSLVNLVTKEDLNLVRNCEAHDCSLFFYDVTKSHRRRWCSMALCGNRVKAAAHRARKKN